MKIIKVPSCRACPYNASHQGNTKRLCLLTSQEIAKGIISSSEDKFMKNCPLEDFVEKEKKSRKPREKKLFDLSSPMAQTVQSAYGVYLLTCPDLRRFDLGKKRQSWYKACFIGIKHCGEDNVDKLMKLVVASDFLNGRAEGYKWKADFEWIFRPAKDGGVWNVDKILTGNYNNKPSFKKESAFKDGKRVYEDNWNKK